MSTPSLGVIKLQYEQTMRALDRQTAVLGELRTRASIVLSATGIVASLIGAQTLADPHPLILALLALTALGLGLVCCILVLWPVRDRGRLDGERKWKVTLSHRELTEIVNRGDEGEVLRSIIDAFDQPEAATIEPSASAHGSSTPHACCFCCRSALGRHCYLRNS